MTIYSIDDALCTNAVIDFLRDTADLSTDESGNIGNIVVGDHLPPTADQMPTLTEFDLVAKTVQPYLVVVQVPVGAAIDRNARSGYAGGTPSTKIIRWSIYGVAMERLAAQQLAVYAAARLSDVDPLTGQYATITIPGHEITRRERVGHGAFDQIDKFFQWGELVEFDISLTA